MYSYTRVSVGCQKKNKLPLSSPVWPTLIEWVEGESNMRLADYLWERGSRGQSCRKARLGGEDTWVLWWLSGKECPWEDGQPYCTLQRPELGNHVRETVLLKIQNSRVFIKPASLKAGRGEGHKEPPLLPKRKEEGITPESWKKGDWGKNRHSTGAACMRMECNPEYSVTLNVIFTLSRISMESQSGKYMIWLFYFWRSEHQ